MMSLTPEGKAGFDAAKDTELTQLISHEVLEIAERSNVPRERLMRMIWVCTYKSQDDGTNKPKARLVILGFEYPDALQGKVPTAAPTLTRVGRSVVLQCVGSLRWHFLR